MHSIKFAVVAEIHYTDQAWPDFGELELIDALLDFQGRERRFGMTSSQIRTASAS